jgi:hypothetical protein
MLVTPRRRSPAASGAERLDPSGIRQYSRHDLPGSTPRRPASGEM